MSFAQNFPFFSIILSLVCAVVSFAANARWARRLSIFLLSASVVLQGSLLVYCTVHHVRYSYMMGHYPAPWGNELTAGILEPFLAMLFAGVMLLCVLGGMGRILQDVPADKQKLYVFGHFEYNNSCLGSSKEYTSKKIFAGGINYYPVPQVCVKAEYSYRKLKQRYNDEPAINIGVAYQGMFL